MMKHFLAMSIATASTMGLSACIVGDASNAGKTFGAATSDGSTVNDVDTIVADMRELNDFRLRGYDQFQHGWYVGPGQNLMGNNPDFDTSQPEWSIFYNNPAYAGKVAEAILPWVVIFDGVDHGASNVAVEMRNMRAYMKQRSSGEWILLGGPAKTTGVYYAKPGFGWLGERQEEVIWDYDSETGSAIKVPEDNNFFWHGWWTAGRLTVDPWDIEAVFVTVQARVVVADPSRDDDRWNAQVGLQVGADYYLDPWTNYPEAYAPAVGISRTKTITPEWQAFSFTTLSDVGDQQPGGGITVDSLYASPPPME